MYKIIKGLPASFAIFMKNDGVRIDLNDGTWNTDIKLRLNTIDGPEFSNVSITEANTGYVFSLTSEQTSQLDHRSTGYVLVVKVNTLDEMINLRSTVKVIVENDI
jgi:hypothetical protein